jgi:hypothetical protein
MPENLRIFKVKLALKNRTEKAKKLIYTLERPEIFVFLTTLTTLTA